MQDILLGFMVAAYLTLLGVGYLFVYKPWHVMRVDMQALAEGLAELRRGQTARKVLTMDDLANYRAELRNAARKMARDTEDMV